MDIPAILLCVKYCYGKWLFGDNRRTQAMEELSDKKIISSWFKNVKPWIKAIRDEEIESRRLVTNQAIIDAIKELAPRTVLDVGCGEGWLTREISSLGIECLGIDVVPGLIDYASQLSGEKFKVLSYEDLSFSALNTRFDAIACNFSLLGKESVSHVFRQAASLLNPQGKFIVQTLHPVTACGDNEYRDGWRKGSWSGFSDDFTDPAPWYFRTIESWKNLYKENGFKINRVIEPLDNIKQQPASIILVGEVLAEI